MKISAGWLSRLDERDIHSDTISCYGRIQVMGQLSSQIDS